MTEKQLISQIKQLKEIKPREEWVIFVKNQIVGTQAEVVKKPSFGERFAGILEILPSLFLQRKLAYAFSTVLLIAAGLFGFAQYTVPGDLLFSVRKATEQSQTTLLGADQLKHNFEVANKRLQDLTQIVQNNRTQNVAPAISEFKASIADVAKNLIQNASDKKSIRDIAVEAQKLEEIKKQGQTLGVDLGETEEIMELDSVLAELVEREITNLAEITLTEDQQKTLDEAKVLFEGKNYSDALEKILEINN